MGNRKLVTDSEIAKIFGVSENWIRKNRKDLKPAEVLFAGKRMRPRRYDLQAVENLFSVCGTQQESEDSDCSLKTEYEEKPSHSSPRIRVKEKLWL